MVLYVPEQLKRYDLKHTGVLICEFSALAGCETALANEVRQRFIIERLYRLQDLERYFWTENLKKKLGIRDRKSFRRKINSEIVRARERINAIRTERKNEKIDDPESSYPSLKDFDTLSKDDTLKPSLYFTWGRFDLLAVSYFADLNLPAHLSHLDVATHQHFTIGTPIILKPAEDSTAVFKDMQPDRPQQPFAALMKIKFHSQLSMAFGNQLIKRFVLALERKCHTLNCKISWDDKERLFVYPFRSHGMNEAVILMESTSLQLISILSTQIQQTSLKEIFFEGDKTDFRRWFSSRLGWWYKNSEGRPKKLSLESLKNFHVCSTTFTTIGMPFEFYVDGMKKASKFKKVVSSDKISQKQEKNLEEIKSGEEKKKGLENFANDVILDISSFLTEKNYNDSGWIASLKTSDSEEFFLYPSIKLLLKPGHLPYILKELKKLCSYGLLLEKPKELFGKFDLAIKPTFPDSRPKNEAKNDQKLNPVTPRNFIIGYLIIRSMLIPFNRDDISHVLQMNTELAVTPQVDAAVQKFKTPNVTPEKLMKLYSRIIKQDFSMNLFRSSLSQPLEFAARYIIGTFADSISDEFQLDYMFDLFDMAERLKDAIEILFSNSNINNENSDKQELVSRLRTELKNQALAEKHENFTEMLNKFRMAFDNRYSQGYPISERHDITTVFKGDLMQLLSAAQGGHQFILDMIVKALEKGGKKIDKLHPRALTVVTNYSEMHTHVKRFSQFGINLNLINFFHLQYPGTFIQGIHEIGHFYYSYLLPDELRQSCPGSDFSEPRKSLFIEVFADLFCRRVSGVGNENYNIITWFFFNNVLSGYLFSHEKEYEAGVIPHEIQMSIWRFLLTNHDLIDNDELYISVRQNKPFEKIREMINECGEVCPFLRRSFEDGESEDYERNLWFVTCHIHELLKISGGWLKKIDTHFLELHNKMKGIKFPKSMYMEGSGTYIQEKIGDYLEYIVPLLKNEISSGKIIRPGMIKSRKGQYVIHPGIMSEFYYRRMITLCSIWEVASRIKFLQLKEICSEVKE